MELSEISSAVVQNAVFIGFIGMGVGGFIGVFCRCIMAVIGIFEKVTKS